MWLYFLALYPSSSFYFDHCQEPDCWYWIHFNCLCPVSFFSYSFPSWYISSLKCQLMVSCPSYPLKTHLWGRFVNFSSAGWGCRVHTLPPLDKGKWLWEPYRSLVYRWVCFLSACVWVWTCFICCVLTLEYFYVLLSCMRMIGVTLQIHYVCLPFQVSNHCVSYCSICIWYNALTFLLL